MTEPRKIHRAVFRYKFSQVSDWVSGRSGVSQTFLSIIDTRWNVSRQRWKKERSFDRGKRRKCMRDTSDHNRDVSTNLSKRGTHGAARRDNRRDFSDTRNPLTHPLPFLFPVSLSRPSLYRIIYIYLFLTFVCHDWNIPLKSWTVESSIDKLIMEGKKYPVVINQWR